MQLTFLLLGSLLAAPEPGEAKGKHPGYEERKNHDPDGIGKFYMDREIAHVMGFGAAGWLERPERVKEEAPEKLLKALDLKPGMTVADIGAGSGYHTFKIAPILGAEGKMIAVDIQPEMLGLIREKAKKLKVGNIELVNSAESDPKLKPGSVDLILMVDVYHEFSHPYEMTQKLAAALKPGGRLVFVEFKLEDSKVPIKLVHKMSERQVIREMTPFEELKHEKTISTLPWQHVIVFEKAKSK